MSEEESGLDGLLKKAKTGGEISRDTFLSESDQKKLLDMTHEEIVVFLAHLHNDSQWLSLDDVKAFFKDSQVTKLQFIYRMIEGIEDVDKVPLRKNAGDAMGMAFDDMVKAGFVLFDRSINLEGVKK